MVYDSSDWTSICLMMHVDWEIIPNVCFMRDQSKGAYIVTSFTGFHFVKNGKWLHELINIDVNVSEVAAKHCIYCVQLVDRITYRDVSRTTSGSLLKSIGRLKTGMQIY